MTKNPWLWIWLAAVGFSVGFPLTKVMFESGMTVWQILIPRFLIGTAVIWAFVRTNPMRNKVGLRRGATLGVVNVAVPSILMSIGTDMLPSSIAGILTAFIPIATMAAAHFVVPAEPFSAKRLPGLSLATAGVVILVVGGRTPDGSRIALLGIFVTLVGVALVGVGGALSRRFAMETPSSSLVLPQFLAATLVVLAIGTPLGGGDLQGLSWRQLAAAVALGLVSTALPFFALLKAAELASAAKAALVGYLVPLMAAAMSIATLGEPISAAFLIAALLITLGVHRSDVAERQIVMTKVKPSRTLPWAG